MSDDSPRLGLGSPRLDLGDPALLENIVTYVGNACHKAMIDVDKAARTMGEEGMKGENSAVPSNIGAHSYSS